MLSLYFIVTLPLADISAISSIKIAPNLNQQGSEGHDAYTHPTSTQVLSYLQTFKEKYSIMAKSFSSYLKSTYIADNIVCKRIVS